jgi:predicted RNA polymerase sigma factor
LFGIVHIEIAEDITNDTFLLATETWGLKGIPENPTAWLYLVAKNKTKDYLKRQNIFSQKVAFDLKIIDKKMKKLKLICRIKI